MKILDARVEVLYGNKWLKVLVDEYDTGLFREWGMAGSHGCFPVHLTDSRKVWKRNHTFFAEWLPIETARQAVEDFVPGWRLEPEGYLMEVI
jgi:hypothetical protein